MPRLSSAARSLQSSLASSSPNSQSSGSPASTPPSSQSFTASHERLVAEALARLNRSEQNSSNDNVTEEERANLLRAQFDEEDDDEEDDEEEEEEEEGDETGKLVQSIFRAHIVDKTRKGYYRKQIQVVCWIFKQSKDHPRPPERARYRSMLYASLYSALDDVTLDTNQKLAKKARPFIERASEQFHPIDLDNLKAEDFVAYLISIAPPGQYKSKSTYGGIRAGLFDLFRSCKVKQTDEFQEALKRAYGGLERKAQEYKASTGARLGEGKKPLDFELYKKMCKWLIEDGSKESLFAWSFLTLTWNLMCRSKNTVNIHRSHIAWEGDCMVVQFAHSKTDMRGLEEAYKRHVYANPEEPSICPILALSVY
jgi:hypothetical protein